MFVCVLVCEEYSTTFKYYFLKFHVHILLIVQSMGCSTLSVRYCAIKLTALIILMVLLR